jgi:hypothetical protein
MCQEIEYFKNENVFIGTGTYVVESSKHMTIRIRVYTSGSSCA